MNKSEVYEKEPEGFKTQVQVAGCCLEIDNKILLLKSTSKPHEPELWGIPGGKLEHDEKPEFAARRELFEETGISIEHSSQIQQIGSFYIRIPNLDYLYHLFRVKIDKIPDVCLSDEHLSYKWATQKDIEELPLRYGAKEIFQKYQMDKKKRATACVCVYLILRQDNKVLLQLRQNSGYCDGMWSYVAGHVEEGESATCGMIREAYEEIGIRLLPSDLKVAHIVHRQSNRLNVDIFFECNKWLGELKNNEPEKCKSLEFFTLNEFPTNTVDYNVTVTQAIQKGEIYSEIGWLS